MGTSAVFDWVCQALEGASQFSTLEARGTIRIALVGCGRLGRATTRRLRVRCGRTTACGTKGRLATAGLREREILNDAGAQLLCHRVVGELPVEGLPRRVCL